MTQRNRFQYLEHFGSWIQAKQHIGDIRDVGKTHGVEVEKECRSKEARRTDGRDPNGIQLQNRQNSKITVVVSADGKIYADMIQQ